ncbi:hypothetical protein [Mucilaginibacter paludis]|uniref:Uncharacterized protein n=1 Tax=Mucilaginibacter paludis DSM 18603 TaxID=714943 RepID=H1YAY1_9SPHI|nr:hypothetical protein [Mucilaginibacter paludis]EHQ30014.1 hypothetical protein Mucpa_5954 [Mucilaginibacter paludis DSM 18603]
MEPNKKQMPTGIPALLYKVMQDKRDIKQALKEKKSLSELAKEKDINFAKPL